MSAAARNLVLVVDDVADSRRLIRRVLERSGFAAIEAATGEEAMDRIAADHPALVVLDLRLPKASGFDVARWVRAHPDRAVRDTVLLACSASVQLEIQYEALDAGCDAFEGKPFDVRQFADRIRELIASHARA